MTLAGEDLHPFASLLLVGLRGGATGLEDIDDGLVPRMCREPRVVEAHVEEPRRRAHLLVERKRGQLLEWVRLAAPASGRRAREHEAIDALGPRDR